MSSLLNDEVIDATAVGLDAAVAGTGDISVLRWSTGVTVASPYITHRQTAALGSIFDVSRRGRYYMRLGVDGTGVGAQGLTFGVSVNASGASLTGEPVPYTLGMNGTTSSTITLATTDYAINLSDIVIVRDSALTTAQVVGTTLGATALLRFHGTQADGTTLVGGDLVEATVNAHITFVSDPRA